MADPFRDAPWQQGDILRADELNAMQTGLSPIGTIIPWSLPYAEPTGSPYSNVKNLAPFHLPATGGVYPTDRAPLLSAAMGHQFIQGLSPGLPVFIVASDLDHESPNQNGWPDPSVGGVIFVQDTQDWELQSYRWNASTHWVRNGAVEQGTMLSGTWTDLRESTSGAVVPDKAVCWIKDDFGHVEILLSDGFCTPDFRGRSPVGSHNIPNDPVLGAALNLGDRQGDWRTKGHRHVIAPNGYANSPSTGSGYNNGTINEWRWYSGEPMVTSNTNQNGNSLPHGVRRTNITEAQGTGPDQSVLTMLAYEYSVYVAEDLAAHGAAHQDPQTVVNWLIFAGQRISDPEPLPGTGSARSSEPMRMNTVSMTSIIRERLSSPYLTDEDRAVYEEMLSRESDPPTTRTATRKRKKS